MDKNAAEQEKPVQESAGNSQEQPASPAPKKETESNSPVDGVIVISPLYKPIMVDGKEVTQLRLDIGGLGEPDLVNIDEEMRAEKDVSPRHVAFSASYCMRIAARACGINYHDLKRLSFKDSMKITNAVQDFLMV